METMELPTVSRAFILAGKAVFTVANNSGTHYTYRVRKSKDGRAFFVSLLTGPDNGSSYTYLGLLGSDLRFRLTDKSKMTAESTPVRVFAWAMRVIDGKTDLPAGYAIHHAGRCGRCGRLLTHPDSIESGIGPECAKYL